MRALAHELDGTALPGAGRAARDEVPAQRVGAERVKHFPWVEHVALALAHLLAAVVNDVAQADDVAIRRRVEHQRRDRVQTVEPTARLIDRLADEVRWKALFEQIGVLERVVPLRVRHRTRIEPRVDDLRHTPVFATFNREHDIVDRRPVQVEVREIAPRAFG